MRRIALFFVFVLAGGTVLTGCASETSRSEARVVVAAEERFLEEWRRSAAALDARCDGKRGSSYSRCYERVVVPRQAAAIVAFARSINALLDDGVGPRCTAALRSTLRAMPSVPAFPGDASRVCRGESKG